MPRFDRSTCLLAAVCLLGIPGRPAEAATAAASREPGSYTVCLQPLGTVETGLLAPIARGIEQAYGFRVRRLPPRALAADAWYPPRQRYRAARLLDHLRAEVVVAEPACNAVLGFTAVDVSMSKGEHADWGVLGLSYQGQRVGVVSSFRMHRGADRRRLLERAVKVVLHELGHIVGLPHRDDGPDCLMNDAHGSVQVIDRARGPLCEPERAAASALLRRDLPRRATLDWNAIEK
jgi:predicted Zn-dependent protease